MAFAEVRERDLDAEIAALGPRPGDDIHVSGHSVLGRLYAMEALHDLVPDRLAMRIAWAIGWLRWYWPPARRRAIGRVSLTVAGTSREDEVRRLARGELTVQAMRVELNLRHRLIHRAAIEGLEHLERVRASGRPMLMTGAHVGGGLSAVLSSHGFPFVSPAGPWLDPGAKIERRGYFGHFTRACLRWAESVDVRYVYTGDSYPLMRRLLERRETCWIMSDVPGSARTWMAGKDARVASGPARLAHETGALVVPVLGLLRVDGPHVRVLEPIDPERFSGPQEIVDRLAAIFGEQMIRHPEQLEPTGFAKGVFAEDGEAYPLELWRQPALRTQAKQGALGLIGRARQQLRR
ncbi:MAG: lysophospholipid acyltransferase family protein [Gaiellaceae bacterium]